MRHYYVYIMANAGRMFYTGVTNDLERRVFQHKHKLIPGYTTKYNITRLVYYEATASVLAALAREKQIKGWLRSQKVAMIESANPGWRDLSEDWHDPLDAGQDECSATAPNNT
jgi:putative endonuclease